MSVPTAVTDLSTTAASNSPATSESVATADDYIRALSGIIRTESLNKLWERWNDTPTRTGNTTFTVPGDLTARYVAGRRIKCIDSSTLYGTIASAVYGAVTTVTVTLDSGNLSAALTEVQLGPDIKAVVPVPSIPYTAATASGPASLEFAEDTDNGTNKVTLKAPATIAADVDITLPGVASTLATLAGTETLANKTLTSPTMTTPTLGVAAATSINFGGSALSTYEIGTFTASHTGAITGDSTVKYNRLGNNICISFPAKRVAGASSASPITISGLPAAFNPAAEFYEAKLIVTSNGTDQTAVGMVRVTAAGSIIIYLNTALANFASSSSTTGYYGFNLSWAI